MGNPALNSTCLRVHDDGSMCQNTWFSESVDHSDIGQWLCRACYIEWLKNRPLIEFKKLFSQIKDDPNLLKQFKELLK